MRGAVVKALVVVTALLAASVSAAPSCNVGIKLKAPKTVVAGRKFTTRASIKNTGTATLNNFFFQLELPDYMLPRAARASAFARKKRADSSPLLDGKYVHFRNMSLAVRKTLRIKVAVGVPTCQAAGSVQLQGIAYSLDGNDLTCNTTATPVATVVARKTAIINRKNAIKGNCTVPPAPPTEGFALLGDNTRCLQAEPSEPLAPVRALTASEEVRGRQLMPSASPAELQCWGCCGKALNATEPYYFNLAADGQCYCCLECTPVYVPDWTVSAWDGFRGDGRSFDLITSSLPPPTTGLRCLSGAGVVRNYGCRRW